MTRIVTLLVSLLFIAPVQAAPALWEVRDGDSSIWLFGSFHILPQDAEWRTPLFDQVLAEADKVVLETDMSPEQQAVIGAEAFARGIYTDGSVLTDILDPLDQLMLRDAAAATGQPIGSLLAMRPWMAANALVVGAMLSSGYSIEGVELQVQPDLAPERLSFLETGLEQIEVLAGAPEDEQMAMLISTLEQLDLMPKLLDKMLRSWLAGTPEVLTDLFLMEMGGFEEAFLERLIYARNRNWIGPLDAMLAGNEQALVIVGTAHLIGDGSVVNLLQEKGYAVERVQ